MLEHLVDSFLKGDAPECISETEPMNDHAFGDPHQELETGDGL